MEFMTLNNGVTMPHDVIWKSFMRMDGPEAGGSYGLRASWPG